MLSFCDMGGVADFGSDNLGCVVAANSTFLLILAVDPPHLTISYPPTQQFLTLAPAAYTSLPKYLCANINPSAQSIVLRTSGGPPHCSSASCDLQIPLPITDGHIMTQLHHNIMRIGELCHHDFRIFFENCCYCFSQDDTVLLKGWREHNRSKNWIFSLRTDDHPSVPP